MSTPIKILFLYANPRNLSRIRLDEEVRRVELAIELAPFGDRFQIIKQPAVKAGDLQRLLLKHQPQILHFSGHGSRTEGIFLENDRGKAEYVTPKALAHLLGNIRDNLFLVVFNACYSVRQAKAISKIVDFTIGMRDTIFDESAIEFSTALYRALAFDRSIDTCFQLGKNSLMLANIPEDKIPSLLAENGADPTTTFPLSHKASGSCQSARQEAPVRKIDAAMQMDVIALGRNTSRVIRAWRYATNDQSEFFIALNDAQDRQKPEEAWQGLIDTSKTVNKITGLTTRLAPDIFLLLRGNLIETLHAHRRLEDMVSNALYHSPGSNLYIAWAQDDTFQVLYQEKYQVLLEDWFTTLLKSGVTDLIEIPKKIQRARPDEHRTLRDYALASESRRERLRKLVSNKDWNVVLRGKPTSLQVFLQRFQGEESLVSDEVNNLAVFYDQPRPRNAWSEPLQNSRSLDRSGNWFIATASRSKDLSAMWFQEAHEYKPNRFDGVLEFGGSFEWLYALLRLKLAVGLAEQTSPNVAGKALF